MNAYVALYGERDEGGTVLCVTDTADKAKRALEKRHGKRLTWTYLPNRNMATWFASTGNGVDQFTVERHKVQ